VEKLVSTIIPVFNRCAFLRQAVESAVGQDYGSIEIIIIDDGSTDDTPAAINELKKAYSGLIRSIRIENKGPGGAREAGRLIARGEFIQYLDSDDLLMPHKYSVQVEALECHPDCDIAYGITKLIDENGDELECPFKESGQRHEYLFPRLLVDRWWNTHTPLYRKSLCDRIGPWTTMRMGEDWEYDGRAGALNAKLVYCPEVVSCHRKHPGIRLTGGTLTGTIANDFGVLIPKLLKYACSSEVKRESPEFYHFSRWAFMVGRQAGALGDSQVAEECINAAIQAVSNPGRDIEWYRSISRLLGMRATGQLCLMLDKVRSIMA